MLTQLTNRFTFEIFLQVIANPHLQGAMLDNRALRKHGMRALPTILYEVIDVTRKGKSNGHGSRTESRVTWSNVSIEPEHEAFLLERGIDDTEIIAAVLQCVGEGYTFGFKPTADDTGYMAYFIAPDNHPVNGGLGLTAFAGEPRDAILALVFKHFQIADETWPRTPNTASRRFR